jgi:hypothetical protein
VGAIEHDPIILSALFSGSSKDVIWFNATSSMFENGYGTPLGSLALEIQTYTI